MTNTTSGRSIDPRFDPAFQPGYDPQSDPARAARVPSYDAAIDSPRQQPGRVVEPPRSRFEPDGSQSRDADEARLATSLDSATGVNPVAARGELPIEPTGGRRVNPFLVALWAVGILMFGLGAFLTQQLLDPTSEFISAATAETQTSYFSFLVAVYGAPLLMATGIVTICVALAVHALRWNRR